MKMSDLTQPLFEMPLGDFDPSQMREPQFTRHDIKSMQKPEFQAKLSQMLSKTPITFNVYTKHVPGGVAGNEYSFGFDGDLGGILDEHGQEGVINLVVMSNPQANTKLGVHPLTPWMLVHRVAHYLPHDINADWMLLELYFGEEGVWETTDEIGDSFLEIADTNPKLLDHMAKYLTMRSARKGAIAETEFGVEMLTQYIVNGGITLNRIDHP